MANMNLKEKKKGKEREKNEKVSTTTIVNQLTRTTWYER